MSITLGSKESCAYYPWQTVHAW